MSTTRTLFAAALCACQAITLSAFAQSTFYVSESLSSKATPTPLQAECLMSGASFVGAGEGVGDRLMSVAPPQRTAMSADLPSPVAACGASGGANAEGYLYAIDAVTIVRGAGTMAGVDACDSVASVQDSIAVTERNGVTGLQCPGCSSNSYTFNNSADVLRVLYAGMHHDAGSDISRQNCNSDVRHALVAHWESFFGECSDESCSMMRHAFRPGDQSGSVHQFLKLLGLPSIDKKPFCNGGELEDNDPIRRVCIGNGDTSGEQVCQAVAFSRRGALGPSGFPGGPTSNPPDDDSADLGLVLPIVVPTTNPYPDDAHCTHPTTPNGSFNFLSMPAASGQAAECPDGTARSSGLCRWPAKQGATTFGCVNRKDNVYSGALDTNIDGRVYNLIARSTSGVMLSIPRVPASTVTNVSTTGAFYRIHQMTSTGESGVTASNCRQTNSTDQLGCLVQASPCSIAFGPRGIYRSNPQAIPLAVDGFLPQDANLRALRTTPAPWNLYPLAHGAYFNTLTGFQGLTGNDDVLAECFSERDFADIVANYSGLATISSNTSEAVPLVEFNPQQCTACTPVTQCLNNDGCCPSGCTASNDNNCFVCGDGIVSPGEACDSAPTYCAEPCLSCTSQCTYGYGPYCGDGIVQIGDEECDDGNDNDNDGCRNNCSTCSVYSTTDATCDDIDDDCDGLYDEDYSQALTECGAGACAAVGAIVCNAGLATPTCEPAPQLASDDATCDGTDDDCDGDVDEDCPVCVSQTTTVANHIAAGRAYESDVCTARFQDNFNGSLSQWSTVTNVTILSDSETQTTGAVPLARMQGVAELRTQIDTSHMVSPTVSYLRGSSTMAGDDQFTVRVSQNSGYTWTTLESLTGPFEWGYRARAIPRSERLLISFSTSATESTDIAWLDRVLVAESQTDGIADRFDSVLELWRRSSTATAVQGSTVMIGTSARIVGSGWLNTSVDTSRMTSPTLRYWRNTSTGATSRVRYSTNAGTSWTTLENTSSAAGWLRRSFALPVASNVTVQFENTTTGNVHLDEVAIGSTNQPSYTFEDEFEGTLAKWQQAGSGTADISTTLGFGGVGTARLPNNADLQTTIDTSSLAGASLTYLVSSSGSAGNLQARYSIDGGTTWNVADSYAPSVSIWAFRTVRLPRASSVKLSMRVTAGNSTHRVYLDHLRVEPTQTSLALSEAFEGTLVGWQATGSSPPVISTQAARSGLSSAIFQGVGELRRTIDTSRHPSALLTYYRTAIASQSQDTFVARYSTNSGSTWTNLDTSLPSTSWQVRSFALPSASSLLLSITSNVLYRYHIDDLAVTGAGGCSEWYAVGSNDELGPNPTQSVALREHPHGSGHWALRAPSDLECDGVDEDCNGQVDEECPTISDNGEGGVVVDSGDGVTIPSMTHRWERIQDPRSASGFSMQALPDNGTSIASSALATSPRFDVTVNIKDVGTYELWVRGRSPNTAGSDSVYLGLDGIRIGGAVSSTQFHSGFAWIATTAKVNIVTPGRHTLNAWMHEDGFVIDQIVLVAEETTTHHRPPLGISFCNPAVPECNTGDAAGEVFITQFVGTPAPPSGQAGGLTGSSDVTPDGAFTYSLPLDVPPGRLGMAPSLSLNYNSRGTDGPLGVGWSVGGLSSITRCKRTFALDGYADGIDLDLDDALCLDGERLVLVSGQYGRPGSTYRTLRDTHQFVTAYGESSEITEFSVQTNDGITRSYGGLDHNARVRAPRIDATELDPFEQNGPWRELPSVTLEWALYQASDPRGNNYQLFYESSWNGDLLDPDHGYEHRLREISYTHLAVPGETPEELKAERLIRFNWRSRPDDWTMYVSGFAQRSSKRLASIEMHAPMPTLGGGRKRQQVWRYEINYGATSPTTDRTLIRKISKCSGSVCGLSAAFEWSSPPHLSARSAYELENTEFDLDVDPERLPRHTIFEDFNGDNAPDIWAESIDSDNLIAMGDPAFSPYSIRIRNASNPVTFHEPINETRYSTWITTQAPYDFENDGLLEFHGLGVSGHLLGTFGWRPNQNIVGIDADLPTSGPDWTAFADLNGDGYLDYAQISNSSQQNETYFRLLDPTTRRLHQERYNFHTGTGPGTTSIADVTGDGRAEIIQWSDGKLYTFSESNNVVVLSTNIYGGSPAYDVAEPLIDLNGDGLLDVYRAGHDTVRLNIGNGFGPSLPVNLIEQPNGDIYTDTSTDGMIDRGLRVTDFDGDGRQDLVFPANSDYGGEISVLRMRNGEVREDLVWHDDMLVDFPAYDRAGRDTYNEFRASDVTGDGVPDLTFSRDRFLHVAVRQGGKPDMLIGVTDGMRRGQRIEYAPISDPVVHRPGAGCSGWQRCMKKGLDVVKSHRIDNGLGASGENYNEFTYFYEDARTDLQGNGFVGFKQRIVTERARKTSTSGATAFTVEEYDNRTRAEVNYGSGGLSERYVYPYAGVPKRIKKYVIESGEQHATITEDDYVFVEDDGDAGFYTVELQDRWVREYTGTGVRCPIYPDDPLTQDEPCWEQNDWPVQRSTHIEYAWSSQGQLASVQQQTFRGDTSEGFYNGQLNRVDVTFDEYGPLLLERPLARTEYSSAPGSSVPGESTTRLTTYAHDEFGALVDEIVDPNTEQMFITHYVRRGFEEDWNEPGEVQRVEWYDGQDAERYYIGGAPTRSVSYGYDAERVALRSVTNALGHVTSLSFHPALGELVSLTDENGNRRTQSFDAYGRVRVVHDPLGPDVNVSYQWSADPLPAWESGAPHATANRYYKVTEAYEDGYTLTTEFDRLGRPIVRRSPGFDFGSRPVFASVAFDALGRVVSEAAPHYYSSGDVSYTTSRYDLRDRVTRVEQPNDGNTGVELTTFDYPSIYRRIVTDPMGGTKTEDLDPDGRVARLQESVGDGSSYSTSYRYSPFGKLSLVTDHAGNQTRLGYDHRGRLGQITSPDLVARGYFYNGFNELTLQAGGAGDAIEYRRDKLGRLTARLTTAQNGNRDSVYYYWDRDGSNGREGKLREAHHRDHDVWVRYGYDSKARPAHVQWEVGDRTMSVDTDYDAIGRVKTVKYPEAPARSRFTVNYSYHPTGFLEGVSSDQVNGTGVSWWAVQRDARGLLTDEMFGGGSIRTERRFHSGSGRLRSIETISSGQTLPLHTFTYAYDANGRVTQRAGFLRLESFDYDDLGRLTDWRAGTISATYEEVHYNYNSLGNLTEVQSLIGNGRTPTHSYSYGGTANAGPHALTSAGSVSYQYDAIRRVNRITRPSGEVQLEYDPGSDLPRRMISAGVATKLSYDAFGKRVRKQTGSDVIDYVPDVYERRQTASGTNHVFYVRVGSKPIAQLTYDEATRANTVDYLHDDHLGSISHTTTGSAAGPYSYYSPWGLRVDGTWNTGAAGYYAPAAAPTSRVSRGFTAHEHDDSHGLVNMRGRIYDPHGKHFLSPDPAVLDALVSASPGPDESFGLQMPGPWPHGKAASSGAEAFSAGSSSGRYVPPALVAAAPSAGAQAASSTTGLAGASTIGAIDSQMAGSTWSNASSVPLSQELNPYSYVLNNPVRYSDPTGFNPFVGAAVAAGVFLLDQAMNPKTANATAPGVAVNPGLSDGDQMINDAVGATIGVALAAVAMAVKLGGGVLGELAAKLGSEAAEAGAKNADEAVEAAAKTVDNVSPPRIGPNWRARSITDAACASGCERVAAQIQKHIGGEVKRIVPDSAGAVNLGGYRGTNLGWSHHEVVVKEGRVYDAFTGHQGATIDEYKALWEYADGIKFGF